MIILGLSGGFGHDAAACLLRDGVVVAVVEEERPTRSKAAVGAAPNWAVLQALHYSNTDIENVDVVAFSWDPKLDPGLAQLSATRDAVMSSPLLRQLRPREVRYYDHHDCHAALAFGTSPHAHTAALVVDGRGERSSTSIYQRDERGYPELVTAFDVVDSLGSFYSAATRFAGFGRGGEGKLMGLASYGDSSRLAGFTGFELHADGYRSLLPLRRSGHDPTPRHGRVRQAWFDYFSKTFGPPRATPSVLSPLNLRPATDDDDLEVWASFAAAVQQDLERAMLHLAQVSARLTSCRSLCLSGGVGLNCSANTVLRSELSDGLSLYAAMNDSGTAIGAAWLASLDNGEAPSSVESPYLGLSWTDSQVREALKTYGLRWAEPSHLPEAVATLIAEGSVVGWFQGPAEIGPRALGHRSILASPNSHETSRRVNIIKEREAWRPFAPSLTPGTASTYFNTTNSPYMLEAVQATPRAVSSIPGVVHADGTSRLHVLTPHVNLRYEELMQAVDSLTGSGALLNTSFNVGHEPIVHTPADAIRTFYGSGIDALAIGSALLTKKAP